jgi:pilus assembly protein CpaD
VHRLKGASREATMTTNRLPAQRHCSKGNSSRGLRTLLGLAALLGVSVTLGACQETAHELVMASTPDDYRFRHPIAIEEAHKSVVIFVGHARGGLTAPQQSDVIGLAQIWQREATGAIVADVPVDTPNASAAADAMRAVRSLLAASGVPPAAVTVHRYHPENPRLLPVIRLNYTRIAAVAGPCGLWPEDLGPSINNPDYADNRQYHNFGCANQRNLAAMIDNPADLVQPRSETPAYTARRTEAFEKYRKGTTTTTTYPEADKAKLSDTDK